MTTILEIIERFSYLAAMPSVLGLLAALLLLLASRRWQMHALGMAVLYFFAALLHTRIIRPEVAVVKLLIGWMIALTLYMTGRYLGAQTQTTSAQPNGEQPTQTLHPRRLLGSGVPFRMIVLIAIVIVALAGSRRFPLPLVPFDISVAFYLLVIGGVILTGLYEDPFRAGLGLLTFMTGFDLFYGALDPSLAVAGLLGAASFLVALAVTFLSVTHAAQWEGGK